MSITTKNDQLKQISFSTVINAPKQKVWTTLWNDKNYREWTSVFSEGSHATTDWVEGSAIQFLDGNNNGMGSIISKKIENEEMLFTHISEIKDGVEQPLDENTKAWSGATERYELKEQGGNTALKVVMETGDSFVDYFNEVFPKALARVKALAEEKTTITIQATIQAPVQEVWDNWTTPEHIIQWNNASADWHTTRAENELKVGGRFVSRMEAKDGSIGFDFGGSHTTITPLKQISSVLDDSREMSVTFNEQDGITTITESFDTEDEHTVEMQRIGWQAILDNFKAYVENK